MDRNHDPDPDAVTRLIAALRAGDRDAEGRLFSVLYDELRAIAGRLFASHDGSHTLQPTALLHEAYLKLVRPTPVESADSGDGQNSPRVLNDRAHFLNLAARAMRQVLVNHARDRQAAKRGGPDRRRVPLHPDLVGHDEDSVDLLALDDALATLETLDPRQARGVELRLFGGLAPAEIAPLLGVSLRTVEGDWRMAKAWLTTQLATDEA